MVFTGLSQLGQGELTVSRSVDYTFSSHLGLIRCLTLIVRVSTQHHIHTFTNELGYIDKICTCTSTVPPIVLDVQAMVSEIVPSRSCGSVEWHGACPSAGTFRVRLEGPATLWGASAAPCILVLLLL